MALTYQPFASNQSLNRLRGETLMNVGSAERTTSSVLGAGLVGLGLAQDGWRRWTCLLFGAALLKRGVTGKCELYSALHVDTRHPHRHAGVASGEGFKAEHSLVIHCPAQSLYDFWRRLDQLPQILSHIEDVRPVTGTLSHWVVRGPLGHRFEWDAEIVNEREGELLAWRSLPGASVSNAGSVRFEPLGDGSTRMKVSLEFEPPAGVVGFTISSLIGESPAQQLEKDLLEFKDFAERELTPASGSIN